MCVNHWDAAGTVAIRLASRVLKGDFEDINDYLPQTVCIVESSAGTNTRMPGETCPGTTPTTSALVCENSTR